MLIEVEDWYPKGSAKIFKRSTISSGSVCTYFRVFVYKIIGANEMWVQTSFPREFYLPIKIFHKVLEVRWFYLILNCLRSKCIVSFIRLFTKCTRGIGFGRVTASVERFVDYRVAGRLQPTASDALHEGAVKDGPDCLRFKRVVVLRKSLDSTWKFEEEWDFAIFLLVRSNYQEILLSESTFCIWFSVAFLWSKAKICMCSTRLTN